jgi:hypothetical protein
MKTAPDALVFPVALLFIFAAVSEPSDTDLLSLVALMGGITLLRLPGRSRASAKA